jgi:serine protease Do
MDDFNNRDFNSQGGNGSRPDYYQPSSDENYYNPPKEQQPTEENTTYHYAYGNSSQQTQSNGSQQDYSSGNQQTQTNGSQQYYNNGNQQTQSNGSNYYQPKDSGYSNYSQPNPSEDNNSDNSPKPPKKSNAAKVIITVLVVCLVVAVVGIVVAITGYSVSNKNGTSETTTSQTQQDDAATLSDTEEAPTKDSNGNYTVAGVYQDNVDSCVGITVYSQQSDAYSYFYGSSSSSSSEPVASGEGSGVLMSEQDGKTYVITCAHVISSADSFKVTLNDGTEYDAEMVGYDSQTDIGVLSIDATGLQIATFADSEQLVVGEQVIVIGCAGGLEFMNSLTSGYISALDRPVKSSIGYDKKCIQVDAAINPGNSGGALFNMQGQVIGINSSKIAATDYEGMGFAIPSSTAITVANSLIKVGYVEGRAKLGIKYNALTSYSNYSSVLQALAQKGYEDAEGTMVIGSVDDESDLVNKDIKQYDMIVAINGQTLTSTDILTSILADSTPGDTVTLTIARIENNSITTFDVECELIESKG